jgi:hypothetical protein
MDLVIALAVGFLGGWFFRPFHRVRVREREEPADFTAEQVRDIVRNAERRGQQP